MPFFLKEKTLLLFVSSFSTCGFLLIQTWIIYIWMFFFEKKNISLIILFVCLYCSRRMLNRRSKCCVYCAVGAVVAVGFFYQHLILLHFIDSIWMFCECVWAHACVVFIIFGRYPCSMQLFCLIYSKFNQWISSFSFYAFSSFVLYTQHAENFEFEQNKNALKYFQKLS